MKKIFSLSIVFLSILALYMGPARAVNWSGTVSADVYDEDVVIAGSAVLIDGAVSLVSTDSLNPISVTTVAGSILQANADATDKARLQMWAGEDCKITFNIADDFLFKGNNDGGTAVEFLVTFSGPGNLEFITPGGKTLSVTKGDGASDGGTYFMVLNSSDSPTVTFKRDHGTGDNSTIEYYVGSGSRIGFAAETAVATGGSDEVGTIIIDPSSDGTGETVVRVDDGAAFIPTAYQVDDTTAPTIATISSAPAGLTSTIKVSNISSRTGRTGLIIINENDTWTKFAADPFGLADPAMMIGCGVGTNGVLEVTDDTYVLHVSTKVNADPGVDVDDSETKIKYRNTSAFMMDCLADDNAANATIKLADDAGFYLVGAADADGTWNETNADGSFSFTVDPDNQVSSASGTVLFDVEGAASIQGNGAALAGAFQPLSLYVDLTGGELYPGSGQTSQPLRTFLKYDSGVYHQYAKGCSLINNQLYVNGTNWVHSDVLHSVYENNDQNSQPAFIGGETFNMFSGVPRPAIKLCSSALRLLDHLAVTGMDIDTPTYYDGTDVLDNTSQIAFYYNGLIVDDHHGRDLILGTRLGSYAMDGTTQIDQKSVLAGFQDVADADTHVLKLSLTTAANNLNFVRKSDGTTIGDVTGQYSVQKVYIGTTSNINFGGFPNSSDKIPDRDGYYTIDPTQLPWLYIDGNYFSIETRGGSYGLPALSNVTGDGGIFIDQNGKLTINTVMRAFLGAMVTKYGNGSVTLPKQNIKWDDNIGVSQWRPAMTTTSSTVVAADQDLGDYSIDWDSVQKLSTSVPYQVGSYDPNPFDAPDVVAANLLGVPTVLGYVEQLHVTRSRLGDPVNLRVEGANAEIGEITFPEHYASGEGPFATIVLKDGGRIGVGPTFADRDSHNADVRLGVNGMTIIAEEGNGYVILNNSEILVDNICSFLTGPDFGAASEEKLVIYSKKPATIRVKPSGVLDLTKFTSTYQVVELAGPVTLLFEPGSTLLMGGGILRATDESRIVFERVVNLNKISGATVASTDDVRVKIAGTGAISTTNKAQMVVEQDAYVGFETISTYTNWSEFVVSVGGSSTFKIGDNDMAGGSVQIGNTADTVGSSVRFGMIVDGPHAKFEVGRQGFFGVGAGVVSKASIDVSNWTFNVLNNVATFVLDIQKGVFSHNRIDNGDNGSLMVFANGPEYTYAKGTAADYEVRGGGNLAWITSGSAAMSGAFACSDAISDYLRTGIIGSKPMLLDGSKDDLAAGTTALLFFNAFKVDAYGAAYSNYACYGENDLGEETVAFVKPDDDATISRTYIGNVAVRNIKPEVAQQSGSVGLALDAEYNPASVSDVY
jgi:hypothetical protein